MVKDILEDTKANMTKALDALRRELATVRTGRANLAILDGVRVDYYGTPTPLNQLATVATPDARLITIKPWERKILSAIERAIIQAEIGLNPTNDGEMIRLPIPPLTQERRKELVKVIKKYGEETKVAVRNARRDANDLIRDAEKAKEITEDDSKKGVEQAQKLTDEFIKKVDDVLAHKEKDIMEI
jgi:ribosome recycling factor